MTNINKFPKNMRKNIKRKIIIENPKEKIKPKLKNWFRMYTKTTKMIRLLNKYGQNTSSKPTKTFFPFTKNVGNITQQMELFLISAKFEKQIANSSSPKLTKIYMS